MRFLNDATVFLKLVTIWKQGDRLACERQDHDADHTTRFTLSSIHRLSILCLNISFLPCSSTSYTLIFV